jgi:glycosyltransferase involved in cell wall biosynthesis
VAELALISVCVATCNGETYIAEQLASILASPRVDEVLVSDDGSRDGTRDVVRQFGDPRLRLIEGPRAGLVRNFEHLLGQARGDQIFLADQDDVWLPGKVDRVAEALCHADLVLTDCQVVDGSLKVLEPSFFALRGSRPGLLRNLGRNSYLGCCMALHRRLLGYALPFPQHLPMHDWWLGLVAEAFGTVRFVPTPLVMYRRHGGNASSTSTRSTTPLSRQLAWRARIAGELAQRWLERRTSQAPGKPGAS